MATNADTPESDAGRQAGGWSDILSGQLAVYTLLLTMGTILFAVNSFVVSTIMPSITAEIGGMQYYSWSFSLFAVGSVIGGASAGPVREALGDRMSYVGAGLIMVIGLAGAAVADDMLVLVFWRFFQGLGGGAILAQSYGLVGSMYPEHLRGRILSLISTAWGVATLIGPGFGGIFAELGIWRGAFWSLGGVSLLVTLAAWKIIRRTEGHGRLSAIPYRRLLLLGGSVLLLSLTSQVAENTMRGLLIAVSVLLAVLVFRLDSRAEKTMLPRKAMNMFVAMGMAYWAILLSTVVLIFLNVYSTLFLQVLHGASPLVAAYLAALMSLAWTGGAFIVATWTGRRELMAILLGMILMLIGTAGLALFVASGPIVYLSLAFMAIGFGTGLFNNPLIQRAIAAADDDERHIAGAAIQTIRTVAFSFGAALAGLIATIAGLGQVPEPAILANAMNWVYGINVIFAVLALVVTVPLCIQARSVTAQSARTAE
ncbi:MAG: MFS transporter [Rhodospirillales bacterium]